MKSCCFLLSLYLLMVNSFATEAISTKEPRFFLDLGDHDPYISKMDENLMKAPIRLYGEPDEKSKVLVQISRKSLNYSQIKKRFNDGKDPYGQVVPSTEKKNGLYKVYYLGKYYWAHPSDFYKVYSFLSFFDSAIKNSFGIDPRARMPMYDNINGKEVSEKEFYQKMGATEERDMIIEDTFEDGDNIWLKVLIRPYEKLDFSLNSKPQKKKAFEPFTVFIKPYDNQGLPYSWSYNLNPYGD